MLQSLLQVVLVRCSGCLFPISHRVFAGLGGNDLLELENYLKKWKMGHFFKWDDPNTTASHDTSSRETDCYLSMGTPPENFTFDLQKWVVSNGRFLLYSDRVKSLFCDPPC